MTACLRAVWRRGGLSQGGLSRLAYPRRGGGVFTPSGAGGRVLPGGAGACSSPGGAGGRVPLDLLHLC